jgi:anti-sigma factor (TIGR02949 family)
MNMDCDVVKELLPAYVDGELDPPAIARLRQHTDGCAACAAALRALRQTRALVAGHAKRHQAPPELRAHVLAAVAQEAARASAHLPAPTRAQERAREAGAGAGRRWHWRPEWLRLGGVALASAACAALVAVQFAAPAARGPIGEDIVASHFRSLQVDHLTDVASTDQHTVKPWFAGKLDFSPPVYDLAPQGYALVGGRLEYLGGRNVAALAYRHRQHLINLFTWPDAGGDAAPRAQARQGIHLIEWRNAGMRYWLVSDLGAPELEQLCQLVRARVAANEPH